MRVRSWLFICVICGICGSSLFAAPPYPEEVRGALVIVGGGGFPESARDEFVRLAGGKDKAKVVVIPTASAAADDPAEADGFLERWKAAGVESVRLLHTRDRKTADDPEFTKPLAEATAVWFSGGDQNRIVAAYRGTLVEKELRKLLDRGGVIGGTSAGAAVMSDLMIEGGNPQAKTGPGLGLLPGVVVDQHFTERKRQPRLRGVLEANPGYAGLGIDEGTAVVVRGRRIDVHGKGTVTACWGGCATKPAREDVLKAG
jgi:cyanophycinase